MQHRDQHSPGPVAGSIEVMPGAIAAVAARAACRVAGVAGLAAPGDPDGAAPLPEGRAREGVAVQLRGGRLVVEVFALLAYGAPLGAVAEEARGAVSRALEHALGQAPDEVRVRVQGLRGRA